MRLITSQVWLTTISVAIVVPMYFSSQQAYAQGGGSNQGKIQGSGSRMMGRSQQNQGTGNGQGMKAQGECMMGEEQGTTGSGQGMMGPGMMGRGKMGQGMMGRGKMGQGMMGQEEGTPAKMIRQKLMMNMQIDPSDPAAVLALKDQIGLTAQQTRNLESALSRVRKQTATILTKEQKQQLQSLLGAAAAAKSK
jgi:hypothetical protein